MRRTVDKIEKLKQRMSPSYTLEGFFSTEEIQVLYDYYAKSNKLAKSTGPVTVNFDIEDPILAPYFHKIDEAIGPLEFLSGIFFYTEKPYYIHNDDTFELEDTYKAITIPIATWPENKETNLVIFNQSYFGGPSKFFKDGPEQHVYYNQAVYDYTNVHDTIEESFPSVIHKRVFPHLDPKWLEGLSVENMHVWRPQDIIVFDSLKLHASADFRLRGIEGKLGLSIFTKRQCDV